MSVPLKLPRTLSSLSLCELWLIFLRNVVLARRKSTLCGRAITTTNGWWSCFQSSDSANTVFENEAFFASENLRA